MDRVNNTNDAADASRVGPDHLVSTESSLAATEVLRGPANCFAGSGAIGRCGQYGGY
jgi:iron complex outermembrane receptor protein